MTAVMRAVAASGPKVLRIGLVQGGRVIEERIIKQRVTVTVGPSEKSMFVVGSTDIPATFPMFELVDGAYRLNFLEGMTGRIALPTGICDLGELRGQARRSAEGVYQAALTEDSRGKVVVGETTFLFQFVAPPPVQPRPQLPVAVTRGASSIDWPTTMIAAFSFLLHFLAIGSLYSDWLDPVVDEDVAVAGLVDSVRNLPAPPPIETSTEAVGETEVAEVKAAAKPKQAGSSKAPGPSKGPMSTAQVAALTQELDSLEMATIGALASLGPATAGVLEGGEVATGALDQAAASGRGVSSDSIGGLKLGGGGGTIRPGQAGGGLAAIGSTGRSAETQGTGTKQVVKGPKGSASVGGAAVAGGTVSNASRVVAGMRAGFRACYNRELQSNPDAQGRIQLTIKVGPGGEVQGVSAAPSGNLGSAVACVKARAAAAQFAPPDGGMAVVNVPVTFVKQ